MNHQRLADKNNAAARTLAVIARDNPELVKAMQALATYNQQQADKDSAALFEADRLAAS